jgi:hypothetical protein
MGNLPMNIEVFSLCDAATVDVAGKLNVLGAFDTIWSTGMPMVYPQCAVALRIRFQGIERGEHRVFVNFINVDGKPIVPAANGVIKIGFPDDQRSGSANLVLNLQKLKFETYGEYSIDLAVDGRNEASLPLFVRGKRADNP